MLRLLGALRPHQWLKNALVFAPSLAAHRMGVGLLVDAVAFLAFSACASSAYLVNDLLDLRSDREHPRKRGRALASGDVRPEPALALIPALLLVALALAWSLPMRFGLVLAAYYALSVAYSGVLKQLAVIDIVTLACLYGARLVAGSAASGIALSPWLEAFALFLFLSLALVKRCSELVDRRERAAGDPLGRGYLLADLPVLMSMAVASGYLSVLVLAFYLNSAAVVGLYLEPHRLWLLCGVMLFWLSRIFLRTNRGQMHDDPVVFALTDPVSLACGLAAGATVMAAML